MYYLKITAYAEDLLDALKTMQDWPERVRTMQANWIGRSEGVRLGFPHDIGEGGVLYAFTTRADTIMGVTFCAVAAEHPLADVCRAGQPRAGRFHRGMQTRSGDRSGTCHPRKKRHADRACIVRHPISGEARAGVGRQLCAHELWRRRGHGRAGAR